ncbi:hypothetical protein C8N24_2733 [Solirubrobacter pauli]|uniref:Uncharacterized protein n=1 Tax=Solirubrobacter pauli TaxID=166793 RepID=A0A660LCV2_9ACTN|nr:hypothetical protein C8N24_2733 [Solirubrobacter pauli]
MLAILVSALVVCAASLAVGQGVLRVRGVREWSWQSGAVGLSVLMLVSTPALHVPGRTITTALVIGLLCVGSLALLVREPALRPPLTGLAAGLPVALLVAIPFLSSGYAGTLGVSVNNDMASHMLVAETYRFADVAAANGLNASYPIGPHTLVAALSEAFDFDVDLVFAGLTAAIPVLLGLTALSVFGPGARWPAKMILATLVGLPFLVAGYYSQGSFKELIQALLIVAFALELRRFDPASGRLRWLPMAVLLAGTLSVYSVQGIAWPFAIGGAWLAGLLVLALLRGRPFVGPTWAAVRAELAPLALGLGALVVLIVPQIPRLGRFADSTLGAGGTGIDPGGAGALGNLVAPLPVWEAFGIWDNPDYRLPAADPYEIGMLAGLVLVLMLIGAVWWLRRGDWVPVAATAGVWAIWAYSDRTQIPYVTAKALMLCTPFVMLLAVRPLVVRSWRPETPRWWPFAAPVLAALLFVLAGTSTWRAVRTASVGPRAHMEELRSLRPLLDGKPTLFLGNDDYLIWELSGLRAQAPLVGYQVLPVRPEKQWTYGANLDIDALDASVINGYDYVIVPRDPAASELPPQLRLVRETPSFALYRRTGAVEPRGLLAEGGSPAAKLDCSTPEGRSLSRQDGTAEVRRGPVGVEVQPIAPGHSATVKLRLTPGTWELALPYISRQPLEVTAPGSRVVLPPNMDRPGPRYFAGKVAVARAQTVEVKITPQTDWLTPSSQVAFPTTVLAVPDFGEKTVPLSEACGQLVDYYTLEGGS